MARWTLREKKTPRLAPAGRRSQQEARTFTPDELRSERLNLAVQMLDLVQNEEGLPDPLRREVRRLSGALGKVLQQTRTLV